nr:hypothetical protein Iba_chr15aCG8860 [Ipomoea batatas]
MNRRRLITQSPPSPTPPIPVAKQSRREAAAKQSCREAASLSVAASCAGGSSASLRRCKPHRRTAVPLHRRSSDADLSQRYGRKLIFFTRWLHAIVVRENTALGAIEE